MKRLSKSGIEYLESPDGSRGYSWGIFSGCHNHLLGICGGGGRDFNCWARSIAYRFPNHYPDGFNPHYYPEAIDSPKHLKKQSIIGVGWVGDVIGYGLEYKGIIYSTIRACPQHTFLFLTKNSENLPVWSPFPENCRVGVTITKQEDFLKSIKFLAGIDALTRYISFEPLLWWDGYFSVKTLAETFRNYKVDWVIIGAQTKPTVYPKIEWVQEIVEACDKAGMAVFLKNNLWGLLVREPGIPPIWARGQIGKQDADVLRQEMPK